MATLFTPKHLDFVSKRVGNFIFSKQFYWLVDQSWVQVGNRARGPEHAAPPPPISAGVTETVAGEVPPAEPAAVASPAPVRGRWRTAPAPAQPDRDGARSSSSC